MTGRGFSAGDIAKDLIGIFAGVCLHFAVSWSGKTKLRLTAFSAGSLILVGSLGPTLALSLSKELAPPPPVLVDFEQWGVAHRIGNSDTVMTVDYHDDVWKTNHTLSAEVHYLPGRWPSIQFVEPYAAWHQFGCFTFSVYNQQADTVTIKLRVDDTDLGPDDDDHMTVARDLAPGETKVVIPLVYIRKRLNSTRESHMKDVVLIRDWFRTLGEIYRSLFIGDSLVHLNCKTFHSYDPTFRAFENGLFSI